MRTRRSVSEARRLLSVPREPLPCPPRSEDDPGGRRRVPTAPQCQMDLSPPVSPPDPKAARGRSPSAHTWASLTRVLHPGHPQEGATNALSTSSSGSRSPSLSPQAGAYSLGPAGRELLKQTSVWQRHLLYQHSVNEHTHGGTHTRYAHTHTLSCSPPDKPAQEVSLCPL